ncbi:MAG: hypothetical protein WBQ08_05500 [Candidatus Sulfotelmatobacter sp.]
MNLPLAKPVTRRWESFRQRPFARLVRLFIARIFHGGGDDDSEGFDLSIGLVLTLLALPGGFVSVLLFEKYGTLLQWMRGAASVDPLAAAVPDEYFFIVLSMVVTGAVAVWRWDSIFPDRRDFFNLVPLPISTRSIFFANLIAMLYLVALLAIDVNAASSVLFPLVVGATQDHVAFFVRFAAVHATCVVTASIFTFFAVFSLLGFLMAILPNAIFKRLSPYLRALIVIFFVALLCTSFAVPTFLQRLPAHPPWWARLLPSSWFLGFGQLLRGQASPALAALGALALPALVFAIVIAIGVYGLSYHRYFTRIPEMTEIAASRGSSNRSPLSAWLDRVMLRTPLQRGCFHFVSKTLLRSESHRLVLSAVAGLGLVLASQALMSAFAGHGTAVKVALSADALAVPFILAFCIIVGLRLVFEMPVELRSNWIFRLLLDEEDHECEPMPRKVMLVSTLPWVFLVVLPFYAYAGGWLRALLHTALVVAWSALLANAILVRFRKLPFTCSFPLFRQHSIVTLLAGAMAFFLFAVVTPQLEAWALADPVWMAIFIPIAAAVWYIPHRIRSETMDHERTLIFEEVPTRAVEVLQLGD